MDNATGSEGKPDPFVELRHGDGCHKEDVANQGLGMDAAIFNVSDFGEQSEARWRAATAKALKGASFEEALVSRSEDGFRFGPLNSRRTEIAHLARSEAERPWAIVSRIDDPDVARAAAQASEEVAQGATGLALVFEGAGNAFGYGLPANPQALAQVLSAVDLSGLHLRIDSHPSSRASVEWLVAYLGGRRVDPARLDIALGIDPAAVFASTGRLRMSIEAHEESMPQSLSHLFALSVPGVLLEADGRVYHNAGATPGQELGAVLAGAVSHLRMFERARQPLLYAAPHIGFSLSADQDLFTTVAKIRALRLLWDRVQEACGFEPTQAHIHAETSMRMMTAKDAETNILRTTIAAFAAAVGGADSIAVLPYPAAAGLSGPFARRIARNTQLVLASETGIDRVADPAAGAGGIEELTDKLCEAGWSAFQAIKQDGGLLASLVAGKLQERVRNAATERATAFRSGDRMMVGVSKFVPPAERPLDLLDARTMPLPTDATVRCERVVIVRDEAAAAGGMA